MKELEKKIEEALKGQSRHSLIWGVGQLLLDIAAQSEGAAEIITQDLDVKGMSLADLAQAGGCIFEIGRRLCEVKARIPHGEWGTYLREQVDFSDRLAQQMMQIYQGYQSQPELPGALGVSKALALLSVPPDERAEVAVERYMTADGTGKTVAEMSVREVEALTRELAEERKKGEAVQQQLFAVQESVQRQEDSLADALRAADEAKADALKKEAEAGKAQEKAEKLQKKLKRTQDELEKLRSAPPVNVVQPDEGALAALRADAERKAAEDAEAKAKKALDAARAEAEKAQTELAASGSREVAEFRVRFEAIQRELGRCKACIAAMSESAPETAAKLRQALTALGRKFGED